MHLIALHGHHIKPTGPITTMAQPPMAGGQHNALALGRADAGRCPAKGHRGTAAHLDKHHRAIGSQANQVNLSAAAPRGSIIALQQTQALRLQIRPGLVFGLAPAFGCLIFSKELH